MSRTAVIIVAAGMGTRAGGELAKQWRMLAGRPVLDWTIDAFRTAPGVGRILVVLHPQEMQRADAWQDITAVAGGNTRAASVRAGLAALAGTDTDRVLIHDAARPLVSQRIIADICQALDVAQGAAPALEVTDALWRGADGVVTGTQDRGNLFRAQTPQGFHFRAILAAHEMFEGTPLDDVEVARAAGIDVVMMPGDERNLKLTRAGDFARAEAILGVSMGLRVGNGFDVHAFGAGDKVVLCGVEIAHDRGLTGHSDADVGMHAVTDAIYGALALGDIGTHFPPSDPQWKGADSAIFLRHAVQQAAAHGHEVANIDVTLICERPKIAPYAAAMRERMAQIMGLEAHRISIKATTSERLGFAGREEGIAAMASALLTSLPKAPA